MIYKQMSLGGIDGGTLRNDQDVKRPDNVSEEPYLRHEKPQNSQLACALGLLDSPVFVSNHARDNKLRDPAPAGDSGICHSIGHFSWDASVI